MILRRRALPGTTVFARGMETYLPLPSGRRMRAPGKRMITPGGSALPQHAQHAGLVDARHHHHSAEATLARPAFADHAVPQVRLGPHRLPGAGQLEPLRRGSIRLLLGHRHSFEPVSTLVAGLAVRAAGAAVRAAGAGTLSRLSAFGVLFCFGISTLVSVRPSDRGGDSTVEMSASEAITFWMSRWPIS